MIQCLRETPPFPPQSSLHAWLLPIIGSCAALCVLAMPTIGKASEPAEGFSLHELAESHKNVRFEGWESDGRLSFRGSDGKSFNRLPSQIVRYGRGTYDRRGQGLLLVDGSWLAGRVTEINEEVCRVRGRYFHASIPRPLVRAVLLSAPAIDGLQEEILRAATTAEGSADVVIGIDGDRTSGALQAGEAGEVWQRGASDLTLLIDSRPLRIPISRVRALVFSPLLAPPVATAAESIVVGLDGGGRLQVRRWSDREAGTTLELVCGAELVWPPRVEAAGAVVSLSPNRIGKSDRAKGEVRRLSDEMPLRLRVQPLFGAAYDMPLAAVDRAVGMRATVDDHWYENAIAMPSASQAVYRGMPAGGIFRAEVAIGDPDVPDAALGSARFRVLVVGREGMLQEVWQSGPIRGGEGLDEVFVKIPPTAAVILAVEAAEWGGAGDRAVWIDPVLISQ